MTDRTPKTRFTTWLSFELLFVPAWCVLGGGLLVVFANPLYELAGAHSLRGLVALGGLVSLFAVIFSVWGITYGVALAVAICGHRIVVEPHRRLALLRFVFAAMFALVVQSMMWLMLGVLSLGTAVLAAPPLIGYFFGHRIGRFCLEHAPAAAVGDDWVAKRDYVRRHARGGGLAGVLLVAMFLLIGGPMKLLIDDSFVSPALSDPGARLLIILAAIAPMIHAEYVLRGTGARKARRAW
jgi:hypothetical protein